MKIKKGGLIGGPRFLNSNISNPIEFLIYMILLIFFALGIPLIIAFKVGGPGHLL